MTGAVKRLFGEGYRVFFLATGLWALIAILVWTLWLAGAIGVPAPAMPLPLWHAHEMVFGFPEAAFGGFFLTAVPNWTGARAARHAFIAAAAGVWLAGRLALWFSGDLPLALVAVLDLGFLPVLGAKIATQLVKRPKPQNLMFLALLSLVWAGNLLMHLDWAGGAPTAGRGLRLGLLGAAAMIAVLGGRVAPAFTRNALMRRGETGRLPLSRPRLDIAGIALAIATALSVLIGLPEPLAGLLALAAGLAQAVRLAGWRTRLVLGDPLLWALHLAFGFLTLGYVALGLAWLGLGSEVGALHLMGIGAVGGMILAVASRATLGHSGRPLSAPAPVAAGYGLIAVAAILRYSAGTAGSTWYLAASIAAGLAWCLAFTLYLAALWPVFWGPRAAPEAGE